MAINPLQPPVNYMAMMPQVNIGQGFAELGQALAQRKERQQAEELRQQYATDLQNAINNPTQATWAQMIAKYPKQREAFGDAAKMYGQERIDNEFKLGSRISTALENNAPEVAMAELKTALEGYKTSGVPAGTFKQVHDFLEAGNLQGAQAATNFALSSLDPERFKKMAEANAKVQEGRRTAESAPAKLRQELAKADKEEAEARVKMETATDDIARAAALRELEQARAEKARVDAKYADQIALADLKKKAADLGLTQAQTGSALAQTKKLGVEIAKAALELEALKASGGMDPTKTFEKEEKLRKEFQARTKVYGELGSTFSNLQASAQAKTGPGDIALITGFMKMLDPGSVVRETEFATARDTAGLFERLSNQAQKLQSGQLFSLDSRQRQEYVNLAKQYLDAAQKKAEDDKKALGVVVRNYRLNPDNVFGPEPTAAVGAGGGRGMVNPPAVQPRTVTVDY